MTVRHLGGRESLSPSVSAPCLAPVEIAASGSWPPLNLREVWEYRELLYFLALRDIKIRYKQTALGAAWALLQPLTMVLVFATFFGRVAKIDSEGSPYPVFSLAALVPWTFFVAALGRAAGGLLSSSNLITKVYFPRLVVPLSSVLGAVPDFLLSLLVLGGLMAWFRVGPGPAVILVLPLSALVAATALGFGLWISALTVRYRDLHHLMTFLIQIWLYVTPVIYPAGFVTERLERVGLPGWLYGLNPAAGLVAAYRAAVLGATPIPWRMLALSVVVVTVVLVSGVYFFRRTERSFADVI